MYCRNHKCTADGHKCTAEITNVQLPMHLEYTEHTSNTQPSKPCNSCNILAFSQATEAVGQQNGPISTRLTQQ